RIE
ncbi:unnamed protein product, partial [Leptidea sinapis]